MLVVAVVSTGGSQVQQLAPTNAMRPFPGFVPDAETAIAVATAIAKPFLGQVESKKYEFEAKISGKAWIVKGCVRKSELLRSGGASAELTLLIAKDNGQVIKAIFPPG
ncbi:MAG: hypothetical protein QOJ65_863 [Fimbriimonadaceae bacterium]|nr:hypothetical protein [Fimbriimonadaceae bacterium]